MEKLCRSVTTLFRLPHRLSHLNVHLSSPATATFSCTPKTQDSRLWMGQIGTRQFSSSSLNSHNVSGARFYSQSRNDAHHADQSFGKLIDDEIKAEFADLSKLQTTRSFPGFDLKLDGADVTLTKNVGPSTVLVRFTVSSSLNEWPVEQEPQKEEDEENRMATTLMSMPEFQVQIKKGNNTLEMSCYFEDMDVEEEEGQQALPTEPIFDVNELVLYDGEPKETEFAVNTEFFAEEVKEALLQYLAKHGIDDTFAKDLVSFATSYEKQQYIGLMERLKKFVSDA